MDTGTAEYFATRDLEERHAEYQHWHETVRDPANSSTNADSAKCCETMELLRCTKHAIPGVFEFSRRLAERRSAASVLETYKELN